MNKYICIHGHFYQPPRENAWLEAVELQDSAYPYHDWNEKISAECYAPNTAARILDSEKRIIDIINNFSHISFNIGPTLLSWLKKKQPDIYQAIREADKSGQKYFSGHGPAIAQAYNHMIMPLANPHDQRTQVRWGVRDFVFHFDRRPEGMWLPETAVNLDTLEVLAEEDIRFTILSPTQAARCRKTGSSSWADVRGGKIDPKRPYRCLLPSGKHIDLFFYDGPIAHDVGFGDLLNSGENFARRLIQSMDNRSDAQIAHIATDGETFGHHHRFGDMALAYCLHLIKSDTAVRATVYGEFLERHPPDHEVEILENTSWSCAHGVERWQNDCGCRIGGHDHWNQAWRAPLRRSLNSLRDQLIPVFEEGIRALDQDPWIMRDHYIDVILDSSGPGREPFLEKHGLKNLEQDRRIQLWRLLEMQRHAMLMFTSCGWFFDEISGIETIQILQYAARAIQLAEETSRLSLESSFVKELEKAPSNIARFGNGGRIYKTVIKPACIDLKRVAAHFALSSVFEKISKKSTLYCFHIRQKSFDIRRSGKICFASGNVAIQSAVTEYGKDFHFGVLHLGGHILHGGIHPACGETDMQSIQKSLSQAFDNGDIPEIIRLTDDHFGDHHYTLTHLFRDDQRRIFQNILEDTLKDIEYYFRQIHENEFATLKKLKELDHPFPRHLEVPISFIMENDLVNLIGEEPVSISKMNQLVTDIIELDLSLDRDLLAFRAGRRITEMARDWSGYPENTDLLNRIRMVIQTLAPLQLSLNLWLLQNIHYTVGKEILVDKERITGQDGQKRKLWQEAYNALGDILGIHVNAGSSD